jgi:hypothetical protein
MGEKYSLFALRVIGYIYTGLMILFIVGFYQTPPRVFTTFTFFLKVFVALFLVYRFNPYFNHQTNFTPLDRELIMFSAIFILLASFTDYINSFIHNAQKIVTGIIR